MYRIIMKKKIERNLKELPVEVQKLFKFLLLDLKTKGPVQAEWKNYSRLTGNKYHCHLNYRYVACWTYEKETITVEVYYVGSRESAPY